MSEVFIEDVLKEENKGTNERVSVDSSNGSDVDSNSMEHSSAVVNADDKGTTQNDDTVQTGESTEETSQSVEELAEQLGWNKEYNGADAVDAKTFILRSKEIQDNMRKHTRDLKTQLAGLNAAVESLKVHNERVYQAEVTRLQKELDELKQKKREAVELADVSEVEKIDSQINKVKETMIMPAVDEVPVSNPLFDDWVEENTWYLSNPDMAAYADKVALRYDGAPPEKVFALVTKEVKEIFPEAFAQQPAQQPAQQSVTEQGVGQTSATGQQAVVPNVTVPPNPVEAGGQGNDKQGITVDDLTDEQKQIMKQFEQQGIMTAEQYLKDIAKMQGE